MLRILCYGDSNTWGYIPGTNHKRYNENEKYTKLLQKKLGENYEVIEEGLNSRTLISNDDRPGKEGRNGLTYLKPCLDSHDKIDFLIIMLGTNELKSCYNNSPEDIMKMIKQYLDLITNYKSQIDKSHPNLIICGIPIVNENTIYCSNNSKYQGANKKQLSLSMLLEDFCNKNNINYINNNELEVGIDGVHLTKESHLKLAEKLCNSILKCKM